MHDSVKESHRHCIAQLHLSCCWHTGRLSRSLADRSLSPLALSFSPHLRAPCHSAPQTPPHPTQQASHEITEQILACRQPLCSPSPTPCTSAGRASFLPDVVQLCCSYPERLICALPSVCCCGFQMDALRKAPYNAMVSSVCGVGQFGQSQIRGSSGSNADSKLYLKITTQRQSCLSKDKEES